jgi:eukaryotic-like serine/threonine-protein kinase
MPDSAQSRHPSVSQLSAFAAGQLAAADQAALNSHLAECHDCRQALEVLPRGSELLSGYQALPRAGPAGAPGVTEDYRPEPVVPPDLRNHPRYEVLQLLGQGGMGAVYKGRQRKMDRLVALKVINTRLLDNPGAVERFQREVKAAAQLDHPNIVRAYDADEAGGTHFLVMEFIEGTDLAKYVRKYGPLLVPYACDFIRQTAQGLQYAHEKNMVHRDIKPHNLMLTRSQRSPEAGDRGEGTVVKVTDFGLARMARGLASESGMTGENMLMGTLDYIAPEQAEDAHGADIRADIYSLGCSLFHLLAGQPPFARRTAMQKLAGHLAGVVPLTELPASVSTELRAVLAMMVARNPAGRYQTPVEVVAALAPFVKEATWAKPLPGLTGVASASEGHGRSIPETPTRLAALAAPRRWLLPLWSGLGLLALLVFVGTVVMLASQGQTSLEGNAPETSFATPPEKLSPTYTNGLGIEFVLVPKGSFWVVGGFATKGPMKVTIEYDFYLGKYEVTQEEWANVMGGKNPSYFSRPNRGKDLVKDVSDAELKRFPVETVSWDETQAFLVKLNKREKGNGWLYRLPKEVEWEYACRGGPFSSEPLDYAFDFYLEKPTNQLRSNQANIDQVYKRTCKVGTYEPNRLGLCDMLGNVWEWCADEIPAGPKDSKEGSRRIHRGGSWGHGSDKCRAGYRHTPTTASHRDCDTGLRVAKVPAGK